MSKKDQVALLTQYYPPETGAASNRMRFFTDVLLNHYDRVDVFTAIPNYPEAEMYRSQVQYRSGWWLQEHKGNVSFFRCRIFPATRGGPFLRALNFISLPLMLIGWIRKLWSHRVFVITSGPMFLGFPVYLISYFRDVRIILDIRDLWPERLWETGASNPPRIVRWLLKRYEQWMYSRCTSFITVTESLLKRLRPIIGNNKQLYLVRNTDQGTDSVSQNVARDRVEKQRIVLIEAGTQGFAQDPETLCRAVLSLHRRYPGRVVLRFAGSGSKIPLIKKMAEQHGCIEYAGNLSLDSLDHFLQKGDVGIASLTDTEINRLAVSRRLFDYARNGMAVILCGRGEGGDILRNTRAGIAVEPENPTELERVLERLLLDHRQLFDFQEHSRILLEGEFGKQKAVSELGRCLEESRVESFGERRSRAKQ